MPGQILVTGGVGFIGSNLCDRLLGEGYRVISLDNFSDFYDSRIKEENIANTLRHKNFILVRGNILNQAILEGIFSK